tara:strand:- start:327 stop:458 length:132 start_codon:yes stop_codon:yes gene_type:complete
MVERVFLIESKSLSLMSAAWNHHAYQQSKKTPSSDGVNYLIKI